ncbi:MAG: hypothetical protein ACXWPM_01385 [Bdellovibrionota bacterium]
MISMDGSRSSKPAPSFFRSKAGIAALLAVSATFLGGGAALQQINVRYLKTTPVDFSFQSWKWMAETRIGVDAIPLNESTSARRAIRFRKVALLKIPHAPELAPVELATQEVQEAVHVDKITTSAAAAVPASLDLNPNELEAMRQSNRALRLQFLTSVTSQKVMTTQSAIPVAEEQRALLKQVQVALLTPPVLRLVRYEAQPKILSPAIHLASKRVAKKAPSPAQPSMKSVRVVAAAKAPAKGEYSTPPIRKANGYAVPDYQNRDTQKLSKEEPPVVIVRAPAKTESVQEVSTQHPMNSGPAMAMNTQATGQEHPSWWETDPKKLPDYSHVVSYFLPASKAVIKPVVSQWRPVPPQATPVAPKPPAPPEVKKIETDKISITVASRAVFEKPAPLYVEAFETDEDIQGVKTEMLSRDSSLDGSLRGWEIAHIGSHWPTLHWLDARLNTRQPVPLLSENSIRLLSTIAGANVQPEAGIVFGKVPSGWKIELAGRSERAVYLDDRHQLVAAEDASKDRYFALLNVDPGAHLIYLHPTSNLPAGAVGLPVLSGTATYIDLTAVQRTELRGQVIDAETATGRGWKGVLVRAVGQPDATVATDDQGLFTMKNVVQVGTHPIYLETDSDEGYTHRYQIQADEIMNVSLFRFRARAIDEWVGQLEGGVSSESGVLVGAIPKVVQEAGDGQVRLAVRSAQANPTLSPETYSISASGQLQVGSTMTVQSPKFFSVQIPEGPALVEGFDKSRAVVWSEIFVSSPNVVNVVVRASAH